VKAASGTGRPRGSILSHLLAAFALFGALIGTAAATGYAALTHQDAATKQLIGQYQVLQHTENDLQGSFNTAELTLLLFSMTGQHGYFLPPSLSRTEFDADVAVLRHRATPGLRALIGTQARAGAAWFALAPGIGVGAPRRPAGRALLGRAFTQAIRVVTAGRAIQAELQADVARLTATSDANLRVGLGWGAGALAVAVLLMLAASLGMIRAVTRPLSLLTGTVRRLAAGDHAARASVSGSAEVRKVAQSVNALADESDRFRAQEAETERLRTTAREAGLRIRDHLVADDVLNEARAALEAGLDADVVYLRLLENGRLGPPFGHRPGWYVPADGARALPPDGLVALTELFRGQAGKAIRSVAGEWDGATPPEIRRAAEQITRQPGVRAHLIAPFGVGGEPLGIIVALRMRPGRPWTDAEVAAVESIAADLGRGLHHARLYEAENRLVSELRAVDQTKSDFLATVSHELRTPLTSITGYVEMLRDLDAGPVTPAQDQMLETVARNAARLRNLIEDVLTLSKIEAGAFKSVMRPVDLADVVTAAVAALRPAAAAKGLALDCDSPGQGLIVGGDAGQLDRLLMNLLSNAVKFTPEGGRIQVSAAAEGAVAALAVADSGIGIPERDQKELFTRFFRASNAVERAIPGTGLGLAIVRTIVDNHAGELTMASVEGTGTTVTARLPLLPSGGTKPAQEAVPDYSAGDRRLWPACVNQRIWKIKFFQRRVITLAVISAAASEAR
jgi:two-component system phosphate regulon sensor histidine kinase PhoR